MKMCGYAFATQNAKNSKELVVHYTCVVPLLDLDPVRVVAYVQSMVEAVSCCQRVRPRTCWGDFHVVLFARGVLQAKFLLQRILLLRGANATGSVFLVTESQCSINEVRTLAVHSDGVQIIRCPVGLATMALRRDVETEVSLQTNGDGVDVVFNLCQNPNSAWLRSLLDILAHQAQLVLMGPLELQPVEGQHLWAKEVSVHHCVPGYLLPKSQLLHTLTVVLDTLRAYKSDDKDIEVDNATLTSTAISLVDESTDKKFIVTAF
eukprot:GEMP01081879.1.p1 GENE.GEMP01081879.1~~GEMP01081879.1.p1  ORF type:complete len:263 (+),score=39.10 GEMP01081879.1:43-831(+)